MNWDTLDTGTGTHVSKKKRPNILLIVYDLCTDS